jgi:hypothetical protein
MASETLDPSGLVPARELRAPLVAANPRPFWAKQTRSRVYRCGLSFVTIAAALAFYTEPAEARTVIGAGLSAAVPAGTEDATGLEIDLEIGSRWELPLLSVGTEFGGSYADFPDLQVYRGVVGMRLAVGAILQPSIFGHVGLGHAVFADGLLQRENETAFTYDIGAALDLTVLPLLDVGIQGAYVAMPAPDPAIEWIRLGVHASLVF